VLNLPATRSPFARAHTLPPAFAAIASISTFAHASTLSLSSDCSASSDPLKCYLEQFLNLLYAAAVFLGLALLVVLVLAYRNVRNVRKIRKDPEDQP
jgi:hypothetical protein